MVSKNNINTKDAFKIKTPYSEFFKPYDTVILKIGGSWLGSEYKYINKNPKNSKEKYIYKTFARTVLEPFYYFTNLGKRVVIVTSAFKGRTDELVEECNEKGYKRGTREYDEHISKGEREAAKALNELFHYFGIDAYSMVEDIPIKVRGRYSDALIEEVEKEVIEDKLKNYDVVIEPGFYGLDKNGNPKTLSRNGTDTSAIITAANIENAVCLLLKDMPLYVMDPNYKDGQHPIDKISYKQMLYLKNDVIHFAGLSYAASNDVPILLSDGIEKNITLISNETSIEKGIIRVQVKKNARDKFAQITVVNCNEVENQAINKDEIKRQKITLPFAKNNKKNSCNSCNNLLKSRIIKKKKNGKHIKDIFEKHGGNVNVLSPFDEICIIRSKISTYKVSTLLEELSDHVNYVGKGECYG